MKKIFIGLLAGVFICSQAFAGVVVNGNGGIFVNGVDVSDKYVSGDLEVTGSIDWSGGNVIDVPLTTDIETAIDSATEGDTLVLASGTYTTTNDIDVGVGVNIVGQGIGKTTIACAIASKNVFDISASNVRIANLSISSTGDTNIAIQGDDNTTGLVFENIDIVMSASGALRAFQLKSCNATLRNIKINGTSSDSYFRGVYAVNSAAATIDSIVNCYNVDSTVTSGGSTGSSSFKVLNSNDANSITMNLYDCVGVSNAGGSADYCFMVDSVTTNNAVGTAYGCTFNGADADVAQTGTNTLTLYDTTLVNGTTSGTITYGGTVATSKLYANSDSRLNGAVNGTTISVAKQHEEIGILLDNLTAPVAIVGFTGTGASGAKENGYESGAGREWTYSGGLTTDKIFQGGTYVYSFDGVNSYLSTPDTADMSFGDGSSDSAFSVGGWVKVEGSAGVQSIVSKWDTNAKREWRFALDASEKLSLTLADQSSSGYPSRTLDSALSIDTWYFVVVTYDGTGGAGAASDPLGGTNCVIYVNGVETASTSTTATYTAMEDLTAPTTIGSTLATGTAENFFTSDMGRLFVTPEELSAAKVWKLYEKTRGFYNK